MRECCGNCKHHLSPWKSRENGWTCNNEDSDCYGLITEYGDYCGEFEEK